MATVPANDGVTLSYRVHGSGPTTLMYLHGWAGSGAHFDEAIGELDLNAIRVGAKLARHIDCPVMPALRRRALAANPRAPDMDKALPPVEIAPL